MDKHFKLTEETKVNKAGVKLHRIMATRDSRHAKAGQLGGFVERESNLIGEAWVDGYAEVWGEALVSCHAYVGGLARVYGLARVLDNARVYGKAHIGDYACVGADAQVYDNAHVRGMAYVGGQAEVHEEADVYGIAEIEDEAEVTGHARVFGWANIGRRALVEHIGDYCVFQGFGQWKNVPLTAFREKNGEIGVLFGHYSETLEVFAILIGDTPSGRTLRAIIEVIKLNFNLNEPHLLGAPAEAPRK